MINLFLLLGIFLSSSLQALSLKDKIVQGRPGDYIITEQNHFCTLIRIHTIEPYSLILEEISFQESSRPKNLEGWLKNGAKGNTSWSLMEIDLSKKTVKSTFSFTKNCYLTSSLDDSFLLKIFDAPFTHISKEERRKIGSAPFEGLDTRKIWNPPLFFEGIKQSNPLFNPVRLELPKDGSILSGKRIELYFNSSLENFPFPYWGQITDDSEAAFKFRVIDSGRNLPSPKNRLL